MKRKKKKKKFEQIVILTIKGNGKITFPKKESLMIFVKLNFFYCWFFSLIFLIKN